MTSSDDERARRDREAILARRQRFVVAAVAGLTTSTLATACRPQPCLRVEPIEAPNDREAEKRAHLQELESPGDANAEVRVPAAPGSPTRG